MAKDAKEENKNKILGSEMTFIANVSHEIRTPMNAILGFSELILQQNASKEVNEYANDIKSASQNLLAIINDLLDISKMQSGNMELIPVPYYLHYLFTDVENVIQIPIRNKGLEFRSDIDPELPSKLVGDIVRIRQILTNIANNAVKYTKEGFVEIIATFEKRDEPDMIDLILKVKDSGVGISRENLARIFEAFRQVDEESNRGIEGTGLGLAITKKLVEKMGGLISVESEYGKGSEFTVRIPQKVDDWTKLSTYVVKNRGASEEVEKARRFYAPGARILIVDDNTVNLRILKGLMRHYQIEADTAESGFEALDIVKDKDYDLIFMDHMMPKMDGVETTHRIFDLLHSGGRDVKVIAVSANAIRGIRDEFVREGFSDYLSKPVDTGRLETLLKTFLPPELVVEEEETPTETAMAKVDFEIKGIDIFSGLINCDNNLDDYIDILNIVGETGEQKCLEIEKLIEDEDYEDFRIAVHAVKSVGSNIGAHRLFAGAKVLELAAKNENYEFCRANYKKLLTEYRKIIEDINKTLSERENSRD